MKKFISLLLLTIFIFSCGCVETPNTATLQKETKPIIEETEVDFLTQMWCSVEISFRTLKAYKDASHAFSTEFYVEFKNRDSGTTLKIPAFWDGNDIFRVRFAPTEYGIWDFKSLCESDESLDGFLGTVGANEYYGDLEIYKHGFVTTTDKKYFVYADGTPFFYLGDTHWAMMGESFDTKGDNAGDLETDSHFKYIVDRRIEQGYTVYQSEPLSAPYNLTNGFNNSDVKVFWEMDKYFKYLAEKGLVHANSQFFFVTDLSLKLAENKDYLDDLARYWVARYSSYPVMWTLAQECDTDYGYERGNNSAWDYTQNPWIYVGECMHKYDAYRHPLTAHQENANYTTVTGAGTGFADTQPNNNGQSLFYPKEVSDKTGHTWWAAQWKPSLNGQKYGVDMMIAKDYWVSPKVSILYEGNYNYLWTKDFGARAQGWIAYLNGFYGYGYGSQDIWAYDNDFLIDTVWDDGIEKITVEDHHIRWPESVELPAGIQAGYMREFLEKLSWWNLTPTFDTQTHFAPETTNYTLLYTCATDKNDTYVIYFYSLSGTHTGTLKGLDTNAEYTLTWFNPRTNEYLEEETIKSENGTYKVSQKPDKEDWVLLVQKVK